MKQIGLVGFAPSWREAPFGDESWELWGFAWDPRPERFHKIFEMHPMDTLPAHHKVRFSQQLVTDKFRLVTQDNYPWDGVQEVWKGGFDSSLAYMLALAILKAPQKIGIWGADMASTEEYAHQRDNFLEMIGFARGRGIEVYLPETSQLNIPVRYYPYELPPMPDPQVFRKRRLSVVKVR